MTLGFKNHSAPKVNHLRGRDAILSTFPPAAVKTHRPAAPRVSKVAP